VRLRAQLQRLRGLLLLPEQAQQRVRPLRAQTQ
jgi:hypothetical protein